MKTVLNTIGVILSVVGFIAGIILGIRTEQFVFCLFEWIGVFLFVIIYFGMAVIIDNQEQIMYKIHEIHNKQHDRRNNEKESLTMPGVNEWKCPKCGNVHQNYVGTCGCGEKKPT